MTYIGNDRFEGYSLDLIDEISKLLGFKYEFYIVADNGYGGYNKETKKWNGLVKELMDHVSRVLPVFAKSNSKYFVGDKICFKFDCLLNLTIFITTHRKLIWQYVT